MKGQSTQDSGVRRQQSLVNKQPKHNRPDEKGSYSHLEGCNDSLISLTLSLLLLRIEMCVVNDKWIFVPDGEQVF